MNYAHTGGALYIWLPVNSPEPTRVAAEQAVEALKAATECTIVITTAANLKPNCVVIGRREPSVPTGQEALDTAEIRVRVAPEAVELVATDESLVAYGIYLVLSQLGIRLTLDGKLITPHLDREFPWNLHDITFKLPFTRRAIASDIMTWHYDEPELFQLHLEHDRKLLRWMAWRGINRLFYIRHARDTRLRIDELLTELRRRGIQPEYGGHILQLLLERDRFEQDPSLFPIGPTGTRNPNGNLCVSNPVAVKTVAKNALAYIISYPENRLFHVWGADVWQGAWCSCSQCSTLSPQLQYLRVVNEIAREVGKTSDVPVTYLAYHDTLEPDPRLTPLPNVEFEWAPRERCYVHAIDDPRCQINPRYYDALKRYVDLFEGRGHVFEYYADAALFSGIGLSFPNIIERDLKAYRALGLKSISCLIFGAYSTLAYPVNLETFAAGTSDFLTHKRSVLEETLCLRYNSCIKEMLRCYRLIERASRLVPTYGDIIRVDKINPYRRLSTARSLRIAAKCYKKAAEIAARVAQDERLFFAGAEAELWQYAADTLPQLSCYLESIEENKDVERKNAALGALNALAEAIKHIQTLPPEVKGPWGTVDLISFHQRWLAALRRHIESHQ